MCDFYPIFSHEELALLQRGRVARFAGANVEFTEGFLEETQTGCDVSELDCTEICYSVAVPAIHECCGHTAMWLVLIH